MCNVHTLTHECCDRRDVYCCVCAARAIITCACYRWSPAVDPCPTIRPARHWQVASGGRRGSVALVLLAVCVCVCKLCVTCMLQAVAGHGPACYSTARPALASRVWRPPWLERRALNCFPSQPPTCSPPMSEKRKSEYLSNHALPLSVKREELPCYLVEAATEQPISVFKEIMLREINERP